MAAAARAAGRVVQVGHIFRFHPVTATPARRRSAAGRLGAVRYATGRFSGFKRPRTDVGVDAHRRASTTSTCSPTCSAAIGDGASTSLQRDFLGRGLDDMSVTTVDYDDVPVIVEANYFVPGTHRECVIVGERGALVADYGDSTVVLHAGEHRRRGGAWEAVDTGKEELPARGEEPLRLELAAFLDACAGARNAGAGRRRRPRARDRGGRGPLRPPGRVVTIAEIR